MNYREFPPSRALARFVDRIWTLTGHASELDGAVQPVLPDGRPELVIHFGDPFDRVSGDGTVARQPRVLFAGQLLERLALRPTGEVAVLGVRFHPFGASAFVDVPQHHLIGQTIALDDVSSSLARAIRAVLNRTADVNDAVTLVQQALEGAIRPDDADARVRFVTHTIVKAGGTVSIDALAGQASISRRHLERRFLDAVGVSPKRLARITRFQRALAVLEAADPRQRGVVTAVTCGYADQSHFIREFRQLAGCSPSEHLVNAAELTGFFVTGDSVSSQRL